MAKLIFHPELIPDKAAFAALCPFGAIEVHGDAVEPTAGCKMCGLCVKKGPAGPRKWCRTPPRPRWTKVPGGASWSMRIMWKARCTP